jgi:hypothetical protein
LAWTGSGALPPGRDRTSVGRAKDSAALPPIFATPRVDTATGTAAPPPCALNRRAICATPAASLPAARRRLPLRLSAETCRSPNPARTDEGVSSIEPNDSCCSSGPFRLLSHLSFDGVMRCFWFPRSWWRATIRPVSPCSSLSSRAVAEGGSERLGASSEVFSFDPDIAARRHGRGGALRPPRVICQSRLRPSPLSGVHCTSRIRER